MVNVKLLIEKEIREQYEKLYREIIARHGYEYIHNGYENVKKLNYYTDPDPDTHLVLVLLGQPTNKPTNKTALTKSANSSNVRGDTEDEFGAFGAVSATRTSHHEDETENEIYVDKKKNPLNNVASEGCRYRTKCTK